MEKQNKKSLTKIELDEAITLTKNWRIYYDLEANPPIEQTYVNAFKVAKDDILSLVKEPGFNGIRIYFGRNSINNLSPMRLILVGVDDAGNDIINKADAEIYDFSMPCPDTCDSNNSPLLIGETDKKK